MTELELLAARVAVTVPLKPKFDGQPTSYVSWELINLIRDELEKRGFDWRGAHQRRLGWGLK